MDQRYGVLQHGSYFEIGGDLLNIGAVRTLDMITQ